MSVKNLLANNQTIGRISPEVKVKKILANLDVRQCDAGYFDLLNNAIAMRELGYTWKQIEKTIEEKLV